MKFSQIQASSPTGLGYTGSAGAGANIVGYSGSSGGAAISGNLFVDSSSFIRIPTGSTSERPSLHLTVQ